MTTGILLTCHGSIDNLDDLPGFLKNIRRGRPTPPELIAEIRRRFGRIGGSPLMRITREQAAALEARLKVPVRVAGRLWKPYPAEGLAELAGAGCDTVISLPLAPHSTHVYNAAVRERAGQFPDLRIAEVPFWGLEPALIDAFVEQIDEGLARFDAASRDGVAIVLTAHSLPRRAVEAGDPYVRDFTATTDAIIARFSGRPNRLRIGYQSPGKTQDEWIGPPLEQVLDELVKDGAKDVLVAPVGFLADHIETLYDLDIDAAATAKRLGFAHFERAPASNTRPRFIDALENVCRAAGV